MPKEAEREGFFFSAAPALLSGATQAILFNPIDRALYLRVKFRRRRFLDARNFQRPFQGFLNAAVYRTLVGASYMFWQDSMRIAIQRLCPPVCQAEVSPQLNSVMIGLAAGAMNGFALNTLQAVKFRMWSTDEQGVTFMKTAFQMFRESGYTIFFRGCITTMIRDSVFGVVYETARRSTAWKDFFDDQVRQIYRRCSDSSESCKIENASAPVESPRSGSSELAAAQHEAVGAIQHGKCGVCAFVSNLMAALLASMLSSPFNYVRSVVYGTPAGAVPLDYTTLLKSFYTQFYDIYRHGKSYTDRHGIPELSVTEHNAAASTASSSTHHRKGDTTVPLRSSRSTEAAGWRRGRVSRLYSRAQNWSHRNHHHPFAAWTWANSRLNIGWGSLRIGFGMAMSQSLFYMTQDYMRHPKRPST